MYLKQVRDYYWSYSMKLCMQNMPNLWWLLNRQCSLLHKLWSHYSAYLRYWSCNSNMCCRSSNKESDGHSSKQSDFGSQQFGNKVRRPEFRWNKNNASPNWSKFKPSVSIDCSLHYIDDEYWWRSKFLSNPCKQRSFTK